MLAFECAATIVLRVRVLGGETRTLSGRILDSSTRVRWSSRVIEVLREECGAPGEPDGRALRARRGEDRVSPLGGSGLNLAFSYAIKVRRLDGKPDASRFSSSSSIGDGSAPTSARSGLKPRTRPPVQSAAPSSGSCNTSRVLISCCVVRCCRWLESQCPGSGRDRSSP